MLNLCLKVNTDTNFTLTEEQIKKPLGHDILVATKAVSLNPVDQKVKANKVGKTIGYDASGIILEVGADVTLFKVGDEVFYAGDVTREGTFAKYHLVDERIVGRKPTTLTHLQAASLPLTSITAYEGLHEQLGIKTGKSILVINGAGGVGSMVIQLAKLHGLKVIATASKEDSIEWVKKLGADVVINHRKDLQEELIKNDIKQVDYIFCNHSTEENFNTMAEIIAPQGRIVSIVEVSKPLDLGKLFSKKASFSWELMFTKSMYQTEDLQSQHDILNKISKLIDEGKIIHTAKNILGVLSEDSLKKGLNDVAAGGSVGKSVFEVDFS
ncbi:NADPH:quinone reductase [Halobacteriovorax marinus]|uniref:Zinc-type alcohol dehydrogenase-like protein n=1 Tax=Halobacteriovorax marinus TaxID=97084 RepID=A0A1Y5FAS6_9BACT|nr:NADPH:quinone reductase [Halobacteriovorax marinus]